MWIETILKASRMDVEIFNTSKYSSNARKPLPAATQNLTGVSMKGSIGRSLLTISQFALCLL